MANGTISLWLADKIQDALLGGLSFPPPVPYVGYNLTASAANGFGTEPSGPTNYGRIATNPAFWSVASDATATTTNIVDIELPRASGAQGKPVSISLYDSSNGGHPLAYIPINGDLTIQNRNSLIIPAGVITHRFKATSHYSQYWRSAIMNCLYLGVPLPLEPIIWTGFTTTAPTASASGTEPTADEYIRQAINNNKTSFTQSVNGSVGTAISVSFAEALTNQGTAAWIALFGSEDGGPYLASALLTPQPAVGVGVQMILRAGSFTFQLR